MKKYKLIKEYPLEKLMLQTLLFSDNVVTWDKSYKGYITKEYRGNSTIFKKEEIENFPDYWQEIKEKEYEILTFEIGKGVFLDTSERFLFLQSDNTYLGQYVGYKLNDCLNNTNLQIYSIKRLSDGEIFTVGDICKDGRIECFKIRNNYDILDAEFKVLNIGNTYINISNINKVKEPLFTTEDNVNIYEGDKFYYVNGNFIIEERIANKYEDYNNLAGIRDFSTLEKAKEWIINNKPCLSIKNLLELVEEVPSKRRISESGLNRLKELVKSKL